MLSLHLVTTISGYSRISAVKWHFLDNFTVNCTGGLEQSHVVMGCYAVVNIWSNVLIVSPLGQDKASRSQIRSDIGKIDMDTAC